MHDNYPRINDDVDQCLRQWVADNERCEKQPYECSGARRRSEKQRWCSNQVVDRDWSLFGRCGLMRVVETGGVP